MQEQPRTPMPARMRLAHRLALVGAIAFVVSCFVPLGPPNSGFVHLSLWARLSSQGHAFGAVMTLFGGTLLVILVALIGSITPRSNGLPRELAGGQFAGQQAIMVWLITVGGLCSLIVPIRSGGWGALFVTSSLTLVGVAALMMLLMSARASARRS